MLGLHLNTHSPTICLGLSEDQWGSRGLAQQGAEGKSLTRAKKGTPGVGEAVGRSQAGNRDMSLGLASCWGRPWKAWFPSGENYQLPCAGVLDWFPSLFCLLTLGTRPFFSLGLSFLICEHRRNCISGGHKVVKSARDLSS